jgi:hypothetical protein
VNGNVYLAGDANSTTGIATTGAHQATYGGGRSNDAYLVKFNSSGVRQWGTYYGASTDYGYSCATDASGNVFLAGYTYSTTGIATTGAHQTSFSGNNDAFLVKFNSSGVRQWGTYYGGSGFDYGFSCATDENGNVYLAGVGSSTTGIATTGAHQTTMSGGGVAFLVKFDACPATYSQDTITACDSYTWIDGVTYTLSDTTAKDTLVNAAGCDSIVSLFLTINNSTSAIDTITACDSYAWIDGVTYTLSDTTAKHTLVNVRGCDSVVSLKLTINTIDESVNSAIDTLNAVESGAKYQWLDCVLNYGKLAGQTGQSFIASANGSYAVEITKSGCIDTSDCYVLKNVGIDNPSTLSDVKVYPNPTSGNLTIDAENYKGVEVYDVSGRLIIKSSLKTIDLEEQSKGLYLLKVNANGTTQEFKVFKE